MSESPLLIGEGNFFAGIDLFDPDRGARRRALINDKFVSLFNKTGDAVGKTSRDIANRARGIVAETGSHTYHKQCRILTSKRGYPSKPHR